MTGCLLPERITLIHEADGVQFRETTGSLCILCFMIRSRSTPSKESEHPSGSLSIPLPLLACWLRKPGSIQSCKQQLDLFYLQFPQSCPLVTALLEAIKYLCVSGDCNFRTAVETDEVGMEGQVVVHCALADLSLWIVYRQGAGHSVCWAIADHEFIGWVCQRICSCPSGSDNVLPQYSKAMEEKTLGITLDMSISIWPLVRDLKVKPKEIYMSCLGIWWVY